MRSLLRFLAPLAAVALLAAVVLAAAAPGPGSGADPFLAGQPSSRVLPLEAAARGRAVARLQALAPRLGLAPAARHTVQRLDDRFEHAVYDEVTALNGQDRPIAVARFETDGRLRMAVRLGWQLGETRGSGLAANALVRRAWTVAGDAGLAVAGVPTVVRQQSAGWLVSWPRTVAGVPVRGDGVKVTLWPDGTFHALARSERPLAGAPDRPIDAAAARRLAEERLDAWFPGPERAGLRVSEVSLAWTAPNDTFDATLPDAPEPALRLAWIAAVAATGAAAERVEALEIALDAGDGRLLGGDVAR